MEIEIVKKFLFCLIPLIILWLISIALVRYRNGETFSLKRKYLQRIDSLVLNNNNSIHLIKVGVDKILLLGTSPKETNILLTLKPDELKELDGNLSASNKTNPLAEAIKNVGHKKY